MKVFCNKCFKDVEAAAGASSCPTCGNRLGGGPSGGNSKEGGFGPALWKIVLAVAVVAAVFGVVLWMTRGSEKLPKQITQPVGYGRR